MHGEETGPFIWRYSATLFCVQRVRCRKGPHQQNRTRPLLFICFSAVHSLSSLRFAAFLRLGPFAPQGRLEHSNGKTQKRKTTAVHWSGPPSRSGKSCIAFVCCGYERYKRYKRYKWSLTTIVASFACSKYFVYRRAWTTTSSRTSSHSLEVVRC